jgi:hypothetical protein
MKDSFIVHMFRFTLKHDKGYVRITTTGMSIQEVRHKVMLAEGCPLSAITKEEIRDGKEFVHLM